MRVLVACEESQRVTIELRKKGHEAYSCDLFPCSGNHPEWHIQADVLPLLNGDCSFSTMDGAAHRIVGEWDMIIAFPPCTYLTIAGVRHFSPKCNTSEKIAEREKLREQAAEFFLCIANADCERIAIENPVGYMSKRYKKPTQIIEPYFFAESEKDAENYVTKRTCLWLKGLPKLKPTNNLSRPAPCGKYTTQCGRVRGICWVMKISAGTQKERAKLRSKTFTGVARAMAEQWGKE
ncbi:MAG: hypothetical protein NC401_19605 [Ruminococcus sp.]|nr:hypothetical protein [Ruminococcus sp.]